jgi:hypothetical protein
VPDRIVPKRIGPEDLIINGGRASATIDSDSIKGLTVAFEGIAIWTVFSPKGGGVPWTRTEAVWPGGTIEGSIDATEHPHDAFGLPSVKLLRPALRIM